MRNYWNIALGISLLLHTFFLVGLPYFHFDKNINQNKKDLKEIELIPTQIEERKIEEETTNLQDIPPPYVEDIMQRLNPLNYKENIHLTKPTMIEENIKEIILSEVPQDKKVEKLSAYMDYYRLIREKIRRNAYRYYNTQESGEVFLRFTVLKDGRLESIYLDEESVRSNFLREIALRSIKEAAPFPSFPEELKNYHQLQFNISIYFKNN
jgi:TonB family protein